MALGVRPTLVGTPRAAALFSELEHLVQGPSPKPLWPLSVGQLVAKDCGNEPRILHGLSNFNIPYMRRKPHETRVLTVHDIVPLLFPEGVSPFLALQLKALMRPALRVADRIICVSKWTEQTLTDRYPDVRGRTVVIPNGVPRVSQIGPKRPVDGSKTRLLAVARFEPYKRLDHLVWILRSLPARYSCHLATNVAGKDWAVRHAGDLISEKRLKVHVGVPNDVLASLYQDADVLLHTSLYEGFCLPAVEALAVGCAVVYQSGSAIDEIMSPAVAVGLPPDAHVDQWVQAVEAAAELPKSANWPERITSRFAALTSWKDAASALQSLYTGS